VRLYLLARVAVRLLELRLEQRVGLLEAGEVELLRLRLRLERSGQVALLGEVAIGDEDLFPVARGAGDDRAVGIGDEALAPELGAAFGADAVGRGDVATVGDAVAALVTCAPQNAWFSLIDGRVRVEAGTLAASVDLPVLIEHHNRISAACLRARAGAIERPGRSQRRQSTIPQASGEHHE